MAIDLSSWTISIIKFINLLKLTFLVDFFDDWCREHNSVKRTWELFINCNHTIISQLEVTHPGCHFPASCHIASSDLEKLVVFEHQALQILGNRVIINLHKLFNLFDSESLLIVPAVKEHYNAHLECADHAIVCSRWKLSVDSRTAQAVAPVKHPVVVLLLIIITKCLHVDLKLSRHNQLREGFVSGPVTCREDRHLEFEGSQLLLFLDQMLIILFRLFMGEREVI